MKTLNWIKKRAVKVNADYGDVIIKTTKDNCKGYNYTVVSFRNNSHLRITKNEHITMAIDGSKLYFKQESPADGYKLTGYNKNKTVCHIKILEDILPVDKIELGCYNLQWDKDLGVHYIDVFNKLM